MLQSVFVKKIRYAILKMLLGEKAPNNDNSATCSVLRTPTILPNIRISQNYRPAFMSILGRLVLTTYEQAHVGLEKPRYQRNLERSRK